MKSFEFESYESTPSDPYVKEVVTLKFNYDNECFYVPYFRKVTKEGQQFWGVASASVTQATGQKKYIESFQLDSRNKEKQIREFLDKRSWEKKEQPDQIHYPHGLVKAAPAPTSMKEVEESPLPF